MGGAAVSEQSQRTEKATPRRLDKARKEGDFPAAKELVAAAQFAAFAAMLQSWSAGWFAGMRQSARLLLERAFQPDLGERDVVRLAIELFWRNMAPLCGAGVVLVMAALAVRLLTTKLGLSVKKLAPDFKRLNPLPRLKDLPKQNLPSLLQALVLLPLFGFAIYGLLRDQIDAYLTMPFTTLQAGLGRACDFVMQIFWKAAMAFLVFGLVDFVWQRQRYNKGLRMSKQEIRDEHKELEGNPQMKARIRRLQRDAARRNMMKEIPTATAVVVNPTHYAVAIRYSLDAMAAPLVVAKGRNYLALRIKAIAISNQVPIIENPPLAQALYKSVDVGQEIPANLYRAVAEVLAYIFRVMNGRDGK